MTEQWQAAGLAGACGGAGLAAAGGALLLAAAGVPTLGAAVLAGGAAGSALYAAARRWKARQPQPAHIEALRTELQAMQGQASALRHDIRGVLSPALMVADRLVSNPDPSVRRAGDAVVRSVERATALLTASRGDGDENAA